MKAVLNDFIGVRGLSGSSRGANLIAEALKDHGVDVFVARPGQEPKGRIQRLLNMLSWDFIRVPWTAFQLKADVVIHATNTGVSFGRAKSVVVLHDTMVLDHPNLFSQYFVIYAKVCMALSVHRSSLVVTPSQHSKNRIMARWPRAFVKVIPWPAYSDQDIDDLIDAGELPPTPQSRNIVVVSSIDKHKRLPMAIEAVRAARVESGTDFRLSFVVRPGNDSAAFENAITDADPAGEWITVLSDLNDRQLSDLYRQAYCVLVASLDEGFCLPALEGSKNGVPVVHANRGALPEVVPRVSETVVEPSEDGTVLKNEILRLTDAQSWITARDDARKHSSRLTKASFAESWNAALRDMGKS